MIPIPHPADTATLPAVAADRQPKGGSQRRAGDPIRVSDRRSDADRLVGAARDAAATDAATAAAADRDGGEGATDHLARLLATSPTIEQAKGLLIGYYGIDAATAYGLLRRWSSHSNIKLARLAEDLVTAASRAGARPFHGLETFLAPLPRLLQPASPPLSIGDGIRPPTP